jgi:NADH-quinone oxidoreductase subunit M|uniref:NADH dehydrogenase subunit 4 n=1 Tax=Ancyromonas sigmoides TaxID=85707 RepID=UPI0028D59EB0|nr:NADH dehydrogenase subunit 4 [Ancyromonas sigmoides]WMQ52527.1 NADH dehydrogenase subunit 4 [Ancyromonas sigmoides]
MVDHISSFAIVSLILFPLIGSLLTLLTSNIVSTRNVGIVFSVTTFATTIFLWGSYDYTNPYFVWDPTVTSFLKETGYMFYADGISLLFVALTSFLIPICLLSIQGTVDREKEYTSALLLLQCFIHCIFLIPHVFLFYIFFESVLIPMYFIIGVMGSRPRRIYAAYMLVLYTLFGSVPMLFAIIYMYTVFGTFDYFQLVICLNSSDCLISIDTKRLLWLAFFMGFAVKVPMVPFHIWLPEAHVEAPTAGSVILAGILLKIGTYGFLRYSIPFFKEASLYFSPLVYIFSCIAIVYTSLTTLRQIDLKKIVAYSSVAHMGYVTMGLFSLNSTGMAGAILIMISHGFVSSALFLCIGVVYDRYKTRIYKYYSGIAQFMPAFTIIFLIFTMANLGLPGTSSFPGEFLVILGTFEVNILAAVVAVFGTILSAAYALWMFNRVSFGALKSTYLNTLNDLNLREFLFLLPLLLCTIFFGVYPDFILDTIQYDLDWILTQHLKIPTFLDSDKVTLTRLMSPEFKQVLENPEEGNNMVEVLACLKQYFFQHKKGCPGKLATTYSSYHTLELFVDTYYLKYKKYTTLSNGGSMRTLANYTKCQC